MSEAHTTDLFDRMQHIRASLPTKEQTRRDREIGERIFKLAEMADRATQRWIHLFGKNGVIG